jgi:hypothetical protein
LGRRESVATTTYRPLFVAGVAGGVGTSTWARILDLTVQVPSLDRGRYNGGPVDFLVTSNTVASTARVGEALAQCPRPPLLLVMHTVAVGVIGARSYLRAVPPHITLRLDIPHHREWVEMVDPPGPGIPRSPDVLKALRDIPAALLRMYGVTAQSNTSPRPSKADG